jgi:ABC-type phosphate transport system substrate-binding protein
MLRLAALVILLAAAAAAPFGPAAEPVLVVVVHPMRTESLTVEEVGRIFLRKRRLWADGAPIIPLNRPPDTAERRTFTRRVLGAEAAVLAQYWNEQYFAGVFPPTVLSSAEAVRRYVAADRDAIGYLVEDDVDASVRVAVTLGRGG